MLRIIFSQAKKDALFEDYTNHPDPKIRPRMGALYFKSQGMPHKEICKLLRICSSTLIKYIKLYQQGGIESLKQFNYKGQKSRLHAHKETIIKYFTNNPPRDINGARHCIEQLTGIVLCPTSIKNFLKSQGLKYLKTGTIPGGEKGNTDEKIQERKDWLINDLEPRLEEAKQEKRIVMFVDAAHFVFKAYAGFLWCFTRIFLASPSGRKRLNVLGAVNATTKQVLSISNTKYINAKSVCKLLKIIYLEYYHLGIPITLVLDNARYQKCKLVRRYARVLGIELLYLPSYSPQLNIIERLWKHVKKSCLYAKYYENFEQFSKTILASIEQPDDEQKCKIRSLLTLNFQSFDSVKMKSA